ncbi:serine protease [Streptomyces sp. SL13]|uniref:Serine protease n=1 Tax=Streptantibioticus silvisoli TaxID=2705255 RepID=A0AA90KB98_9ACTN|nr:serine protease [Streptantibioticus silvisoli]MDI5973032.1 serine protease [Streptantibioticus silvisoli]
MRTSPRRRTTALWGGLALLSIALPLATSPAPAVAHPARPGDSAGESVVGGSPTLSDVHPFVVALASKERFGADRSGQFCGGAVVAPGAVVTAAHCFSHDVLGGTWRELDDLKVVAGRTDLGTDAGQEVGIRDVWVDPAYDARTNANDLAVIRLDQDLPGHPAIPVAGPSDTAAFQEGTSATVYGWGDTSGRGSYSSQLRSAQVTVMPDESCAHAYPGSVAGTYLAPSMLCAGTSAGGHDACQGDSGGPLVAQGRLIGLVSWGTGCGDAGHPGVYTRVSAVADDIARFQ